MENIFQRNENGENCKVLKSLSCPFLLYDFYDSFQGRLLQLQSLPRVECNVSHDFTFPLKNFFKLLENLYFRGIGSECPKATEFCFLDQSYDENLEELCKVIVKMVGVVCSDGFRVLVQMESV